MCIMYNIIYLFYIVKEAIIMKMVKAAVLLLITLMSVLFIPQIAKSEPTIDVKLAPYQVVIDKVNTEYNTTIYIPDENKEKVYSKIKDMSMEEVEELLKQSLEATNQIIFDNQSITTYTTDSCIVQGYGSANTLDTQDNGEYIYDSAVGNNSQPNYIPNITSSLELIPLQ